MTRKIKDAVKKNIPNITKKYESLSDFFMNAPADEQRRIFTEAAHRANEDQMKIFKEAERLKTKNGN